MGFRWALRGHLVGGDFVGRLVALAALIDLVGVMGLVGLMGLVS